MPLPGEELGSIDFEAVIGGPLVAVVNAQAQSAKTTINFIKTVGFKQPEENEDDFDEEGDHQSSNEPIYVSFTYPKEITPYQPAQLDDDGNETSPAVDAVYEDHELRVPILTMLPIPYIRIEEVTVDFNAKINTVEYRKTDATLKFSKTFEGKYGNFLTGSAKLKTSFSYQKNTERGSRVERTYSLAVHVRAVQDEMPAGMERILGILEDAIVAKPTGDRAGHPVDREPQE